MSGGEQIEEETEEGSRTVPPLGLFGEFCEH